MVKRNSRNTIQTLLLALLAGATLAMTPLQAQVGELVFMPNDQTEATSSIHFVKSGETLYSLSRKYDLPVERIKELNGLTQNTIYPGQRLIVESTTRSAEPAAARVAAPEPEPQAVVTTTPVENTRSLGDLFKSAEPASETPASFTTDTYLVSRMREREVTADPNTTQVEKRIYYQVRKGDDLFSIADTYQVLPDEILEWNGISAISPGQVIIVAKRLQETNTTDLKESEAKESAEKARMARMQWETNQAATNSRGMAEPSSGGSYASAASTSASGYRTRSNYENTSTRSNPSGNTIEHGKFQAFTDTRATRQRFYAAHKTLSPGSKFKLMIPNNTGFVEVEVISRLDSRNPVLVALSPACVQILEGAGGGQEITIMYE
ncbi:MAG: LysM peptidoglycan-binding domain-containing protein [Bacteroidia bacterium]